MYLTGCYVITGKLGNFSWLSCVYCYIITIIRLYRSDGVCLVQYLYRIIKFIKFVNVLIIFVGFVLYTVYSR